jgi:hypothetical protein
MTNISKMSMNVKYANTPTLNWEFFHDIGGKHTKVLIQNGFAGSE